MSTTAKLLPPGLKTEDEILDAGFAIMKKESGIKTARYYFCYSEDYPADFIADYRDLEDARKTVDA